MVVKKTDAKDRSGKVKNAAAAADKETAATGADDSGGSEGQLTEVKPKTGEPSDNLHRRADWFQKRH
jgi:hypothetical protein